jgi:hypothetical protein
MSTNNWTCGRCNTPSDILYSIQEVRHHTEYNSYGRPTGTRGRILETIKVCSECYALKMPGLKK